MVQELGQAKLPGLTKQHLREMRPEELKAFGVTAIEPVDGNMPRNWRLAGKSFSLQDNDPKLLKELKTEYPSFAKDLDHGVRFSKTAYLDFSPFSFKSVVLKDGFLNRTQDFIDADKEMWPSLRTIEEREARRRALGLTWHHVEDGKTLQLVPAKLHDRIAHTGGVAVAKNRGSK